MAITIDCNDPKTTVNQVPCITCISDSQLMVLLVPVLNDYLSSLRGSDAYTLPDDTSQLVQDSACYTCLSQRRQLELMATLLGALAYGTENDPDIPHLQEQAKCLVCADPNQIRAILLRLLCLVVDALLQPA